MRVLFFNYEYPPLGGGAAHASAYLLEEFSKIPDLEVDFITSSCDREFHLEKMGENVRLHKLPVGKNSQNLHFQSQKDLLVYAWKAYCYSRKLIKNNKYDLTHSFFTVPCGFVSLILKLQYGMPYIISLRGSDVPGYSDRFSLVYKFLTPLITFIWKKSGAVIPNSQGLKELALKSRPEQEMAIIYNGIDIDRFKPGSEIKNHDKFIITLGGTRVTHRKGIGYLIEAVSQLSQKYPQIIMKVIGEGDEKEKLTKLVSELGLSERIHFLGKVDEHGKMVPFYQEASVFVLPSLNEGMSNAMLEALAAGLPILATDTGGTRELVQDGENGFILKMKDSADIAQKLEKLINNPELCKRMGENSREKALEMSWETVAEKYYKLYEKIL
jgi:L-malate glycosyltransferase